MRPSLKTTLSSSRVTFTSCASVGRRLLAEVLMPCLDQSVSILFKQFAEFVAAQPTQNLRSTVAGRVRASTSRHCHPFRRECVLIHSVSRVEEEAIGADS